MYHTQGSTVPEPVVNQLLANVRDIDERASYSELKFNLDYLQYYGYLGSPDASRGIEQVSEAVENFQRFFGLEATGDLDVVTSRAMLIPRCGVPDVQPLKVQLQGKEPPAEAKWRKKKLTYYVEQYVHQIPPSVQDDIIRTAWQSWEHVADIKLEQVSSGTPDIVIRTGRGRRSQFDGPGNTLAWAYLPPGDDSQLEMRFDLDEFWVVDLGVSAREIRMLNVAAHEFGHLLGLEHSNVQSALMAPFYAPGLDKPQDRDDIPRIVALYGKPTVEPPPTDPDKPKEKLIIEIDGVIDRINIPGYQLVKAA